MPLQPWMRPISVEGDFGLRTDQDLLTREEARERLAAEIDVEFVQLARLLRSGPGAHAEAELDVQTRRLLALMAACANLSRPGR